MNIFNLAEKELHREGKEASAELIINRAKIIRNFLSQKSKVEIERLKRGNVICL
jgi:hypothetical protein